MSSIFSLFLLLSFAVLTLAASPFSHISRPSSPSSPSSPSPRISSSSPLRRPHENFRTILERQYSLGLRPRPQASGNVSTHTLLQPLDHFDHLNTQTWNQTYWLNTQFWDGTGPVFLFLGGEWMEGPNTLEYGYETVMTLWAKTFNGAMVDIQHRYYDGNNPPSKERDTTGLQYLSSQQALADAARVVAHLNHQWGLQGFTNLKWIHVGGSYAGNMAAWYRLKYPNLSVGAFAISGPVQATVDYTGFFSVEGHDLPASCLNMTRSAVSELDGLVSMKGKGWDKVAQDFGVNITSELDAAAWAFPLGWDLLGGGGICRQNKSGETPYQTLARVWKDEFGTKFNITYDPNNVWPGYSWLWYYQTCSEMGYYQTGTDFDKNPLQVMPKFMSPVYFTTACEKVYGIKQSDVYKNSAWTNTYYGGKNLTTTNTFFTHGDADGWSAAGVTYTDRPVPVFGNSVHVISKGTHCSDLYFPSDRDSDALKAVHAAQLDQIKQWLS